MCATNYVVSLRHRLGGRKLLKVLYVISMAVAFSMEVNKVALPFFLKYEIAIAWIVIAMIERHGLIKES